MNKPQKLFTKSAFKVALECPAQLYYYHESGEYANQSLQDEFLRSLAEGGFQVGELAKIYCEVDKDCDLSNFRGYDESVARTRDLLMRDNVTIAEAAFRFGNLFIRADILHKCGNKIDLIEVKAKSWTSEGLTSGNPSIETKINSNGEEVVPPAIRMYIYDVAFQRYVLENALREMGFNATIRAYLMLADKSKVASVGGINQCFKLKKNGNETLIEPEPDAFKLKNFPHILTKFDVDETCRKIIAGQTAERQDLMGGQGFVDFVNEKATWYCNHERHFCKLSPACYKCPFYATDETPEKKDGYVECWTEKAHFRPEDFKRPLLKELWGGGNTRQRGELFKQKLYFLDAITADDIGFPGKQSESSGLDYCQRKIVQIGLTTNRPEMLDETLRKNIRPDGTYLDIDELRREMRKWTFPLHMIDFETTTVALPFYAEMRPYESVAFQFSHHVIEKDASGYRIRHAGQYINTERGKFPNFDFIRALKSELEGDNGTVFRYSTHENSILNAIREQLNESSEPDKEELIHFINTITHNKKEERPGGPRDMVDLCDIVKRFFYHPSMKGSNSIKAVLPAVLNASTFLQEKYARPIYGTEIPSQNIPTNSPIAWISKTASGIVENPYKKLPNVADYFPQGLLPERDNEDTPESGFTINNGGAALTAYSTLQFCDQEIVEPLKKALLRYCELDTFAMVFIWEYFNEACSQSN